MFEKLKRRWNVRDNWHFTVIMVVFAVTGSTAAKITGPLLKAIPGFAEMHPFLFDTIYLVATLVLYQFLLVFFGWLFGEFDFFYNFLKRFLGRMGFKWLFRK